MLDVIEHLSEPEKFMERLHQAMSAMPDARLVLSTGNVGFFVTRLMLLLGQFNYGKRGILDMTHTRLFTFTSLRRLLEQSGFRIAEVRGVPGPFPLAMGDTRLSRLLVTPEQRSHPRVARSVLLSDLHGPAARSLARLPAAERRGAVRDPGAEMRLRLVPRERGPAAQFRRIARLLCTPAFLTAAKILVSVGLLVWLIDRVRLTEQPLSLGEGDWRALVVVWLLQSLLPLVQAARWRLIAAALGSRLPFAAAVTNVYIGQFFNQVLPSSVGGDAVRVWKLTRASCRFRWRSPASHSTASSR